MHLTVNDRRSSCLQGKRQIDVFDLLIQVGLFPFYMYIDSLSFTWNLVVAESKTVKQSAEHEMRQDSELEILFCPYNQNMELSFKRTEPELPIC